MLVDVVGLTEKIDARVLPLHFHYNQKTPFLFYLSDSFHSNSLSGLLRLSILPIISANVLSDHMYIDATGTNTCNPVFPDVLTYDSISSSSSKSFKSIATSTVALKPFTLYSGSSPSFSFPE